MILSTRSIFINTLIRSTKYSSSRSISFQSHYCFHILEFLLALPEWKRIVKWKRKLCFLWNGANAAMKERACGLWASGPSTAEELTQLFFNSKSFVVFLAFCSFLCCNARKKTSAAREQTNWKDKLIDEVEGKEELVWVWVGLETHNQLRGMIEFIQSMERQPNHSIQFPFPSTKKKNKLSFFFQQMELNFIWWNKKVL